MARDPAENVEVNCAVLGMDIVSFSTLRDEAQMDAIKRLLNWINAAVSFQMIEANEYRWSPAGDGGYLTFVTQRSSEKALHVAFSILEKGEMLKADTRGGSLPIELRFGLHAGTVKEGEEIAGRKNIWGSGINIASRILSVAANSQVLVSTEYYNSYVKNRQDREFQFDKEFTRTVKHGVRVDVLNARRGSLGLGQAQELCRRWKSVGEIWNKAVESYRQLVDDTLDCKVPIVAFAAAKFLLELTDDSPMPEQHAERVFARIGSTERPVDDEHLFHHIFNFLPPGILRHHAENCTPRLLAKGSVLMSKGDQADSCYFLVYGNIGIEGTEIEIPAGEIVGEFALWIPGLRRTATIVAKDDSMLLEVKNDLFRGIFRTSKAVEQQIISLIKSRLLMNLLRTEGFFTGLGNRSLGDTLGGADAVQKHAPGETLDLTSDTYVLYHGKVRIFPSPLEGSPFEIESAGGYSTEKLFGVPTDHGDAEDGDKAEVIEESVTVRLPHEKVRQLVQESPEMQKAWDAIWGQRHWALLRRIRPGSREAGRRVTARK